MFFRSFWIGLWGEWDWLCLLAQQGAIHWNGNLSSNGKHILFGLVGGFSLFCLVESGCALGLCQRLTFRRRLTQHLLFQVTNKQRREQQRLEKKKRQEERHRLKALESRSSHRDKSEAEASEQVTLVKTFAALNIWRRCLLPAGAACGSRKKRVEVACCAPASRGGPSDHPQNPPRSAPSELVSSGRLFFCQRFVSDVFYFMKVQWSHSCSVIKRLSFRVESRSGKTF